MPLAEAEIARGRLLELVPNGFEERAGDGWVELAAYVADEVEPSLRATFPELTVRSVEPGWEERWRDFHRPVRVGGVWVGPPWEPPPPREPAVVVDPGRAFGTGAHPSTRLCIELLAGSERCRILDAGCGSGVVAVAAARLGFPVVTAVDADPVAVEVARATARRNAVSVHVDRLDVLADELPQADLVVANIDLPTVEAFLARRPAPHAITAGYLRGEKPRVVDWRVLEERELDGWAAHRLLAA